MASRSGRRGNLPPESKELLDGAAMEWDDDDPEEGPAAETNVTKLQPRLQSSQSPTTKAGSISIPEVGVPTATKKTAAAPNNHAVMSPRNVVGARCAVVTRITRISFFASLAMTNITYIV